MVMLFQRFEFLSQFLTADRGNEFLKPLIIMDQSKIEGAENAKRLLGKVTVTIEAK